MALVIETFEAIGVTRLSRWIFNCYLVHDGGEGRPVVIDAGLPVFAEDLVPVMDRLGLELPALVSIVATHGHSDHVGGAPVLASRSGATVHLPVTDRDYLAGVTPRTPPPRAVAAIWPTLFDQPFDRRGAAEAARGAKAAGYGTSSGMRWPAERAVEFVANGGALPGAPDWVAIATPGHTDDSLAFWNERTRTLMSGDAVLSTGGRAWITPETVDPSANAATGARLRSLDVAHLLPGHGRPVHGEHVTARAFGPSDAPRGVRAFSTGLARCLTGRVPAPSDLKHHGSRRGSDR
jgi:glyoxylase-like metal-dependent hydrolase (beta-lactamase superfamily II)